MGDDEAVRTLVQTYAPREFLENEDAYDYLCSLLASSESSELDDDLVDIISQFFGQDDGAREAAQSLAKSIADLALAGEQHESPDSSKKQFIATTSAKTPTTFQVSEEEYHHHHDNVESTSDESANSADKAQEQERRQQKREERKAERQRRRKQDKLQKSNDPSSKESQFVDDDISAWEERQSVGKAWGGRGYGGRGVRGDVNTASNIHLSNVTLQFAGNELLQNSTIQINGGHRYGLIGRNGVGKTTLLHRLAAKAIPGLPLHLRILLVKQQVDGSKQSALDMLIHADTDRAALLEEQADLERIIEQNSSENYSTNDLEEAVERLGEVAAELDAIQADRAEERAKDILLGLQFTKQMMEAPTEQLSGGWRMRLALAQALFVTSDLILLDEPTNHLDLHALLWLTNYLSNSSHTLIVVSHDRVFLDMCTDIITLEHKKLHYHVGNYSAYEQQQEEKAARQAQILDAADRQRAKAVAFIQKQESSSSKKYQDPKKQRQAKMIKEKKLERIGNYREDGKRYKTRSLAKLSEDHLRLAEKVHIEADEPVLKLRFPDPTWSPGMTPGSALIKLEDLSFGYADNQPLLDHLTLDFNRESKVALVGRNGAGKSTLLKIITGELTPGKGTYRFRGQIWRHPNLRIGHVTQHSVEALDEFAQMTVVQYAEEVILSRQACLAVIQKASGNVRQYLGAFGLGGKHAHRAIGTLSGGERMRLCFAAVLAEQPQLLVLDEPTNHLDMETLDSLSAALDAFQGAVIIVSHNQGFLSGFCKELWVVENGRVDVRYSETNSFDEMFTQYRSEALASANTRSDKRQVKATMAKRAAYQRAGAKQNTGFIP